VLNATGPWADITLERAGTHDPPLIRPTRGSHVHVSRKKLPHQSALILESPVDGRIMFVLPWGDLTMIGTTDDFYEGPPEDVVPTAGDVTYLLDSANALFPEANIGIDDVLSAWAGLRPLVTEEGAAEGAVSREFIIREDPRGLFTIAGGKLTSHRSMAEELVDRTRDYLKKVHDIKVRRRKSDTEEVPLPGGDFESLDELCTALRPEAEERGLSAQTADWLARAHGTRFHHILELIDGNPALAAPIVDDRPYVLADAAFAAASEMAVHAEDVLYRRTHVGLETRVFETACQRVVDVMAETLGWDADRRVSEATRAHAIRSANRAYRAEVQE
jgi:glycerol-3-phosphate dehydrogenase